MFFRNLGNFNELQFLTSQNLVLIIIKVRTSNIINELLSVLAGGAMGKAKCMNGILFFCLTSIFLDASLIIDMKEMPTKKITMTIGTIAGIIRRYSICNAANNATYCVRIASSYRETEKSKKKNRKYLIYEILIV
jgi:hypothetical protein